MYELTSPIITAPNMFFPTAIKKFWFCTFIIMFDINANKATPIPSLNNDSPSITVDIPFGNPNLFSILVAAIGSVGEIILPIKKQIAIFIFRCNKLDRI